METVITIAGIRSVLGNAALPTQHIVRPAPAIEAGSDGLQQFGKRCKVAIKGGETPSQFPDSFDWSELGTVGRQEAYSAQAGPGFRSKAAGVRVHAAPV